MECDLPFWLNLSALREEIGGSTVLLLSTLCGIRIGKYGGHKKNKYFF